MPSPTTAHSAAIYTRISADREGDALGVQRQRTDCEALAKREGLTVAHVYADNDIGASTRSRKRRPQYEAMIQAANEGRIRVIVAYSNSRLTRRPADLEELIQLHERTGVEIRTVVSGRDNLAVADGRMTARIKASVDAAEAERIGERVARKHDELRAAGKSGGGVRPFGYEPDRVTVRESEAEIYRALVAKALSGHTVASLVRWLNTQKVPTIKGGQWSASTIKTMLRNPRYAGLRATWANNAWGVACDAAGNPIKAVWNALIPADEWEALQASLKTRGTTHKDGKRDARKYLLTGIAKCGACGGPMRGMPGKGESFAYKCANESKTCGKVSRIGSRVDVIATNAAMSHLEALLNARNAAPVPFNAQEDIERLEKRLAEALEAWQTGILPAADYFPLRAELEAQRKALTAQRDAHTEQEAAHQAAVKRVQHWEALTLRERNETLRRIFRAVIINPLPIGEDGRKVRAWDRSLIVPVFTGEAGEVTSSAYRGPAGDVADGRRLGKVSTIEPDAMRP